MGAEITRTAYFLGRRVDYVLRVAAYEPPRLLDMISAAGPMPMHVTYTFEPERLVTDGAGPGTGWRRRDGHTSSA